MWEPQCGTAPYGRLPTDGKGAECMMTSNSWIILLFSGGRVEIMASIRIAEAQGFGANNRDILEGAKPRN